MLRLEDVTLRLGAFTLSLSLDVPKGARVALMGASGSGKSTLLSVIAGFSVPDRGTVWINGADVTHAPVAERPMSILFQDGNLFPHLTAQQNVAVGIEPGLTLRREDQERVTEALEKVGLDGMGHRKPAELSGGQQSRVALARMLLQDRPLVLLDEPFAALDPGLRREMLDLVKALCAETGQTLVMVTHDLRDAERLCDHLLLLEGGTVVLDAPLAGSVAERAPVLEPWM
ncbi:thiamine ABC transporter ATP-binding protein [Hasllibacter sp. MH4015]|uniref:thiamine ABC transporter ATP-binding protein n=1 Tax=Hasllibacter sp. MH4015 TaxID=2854029 RepID=UPI001CD66178|nr:thiamine ABC transporter ATP-binding protein [Hasllibacter sp. MH4015]